MGRRTILTITTPLHRCLRRSDRQDRWRGARAMGSIRSEPAKPPAIWGMSADARGSGCRSPDDLHGDRCFALPGLHAPVAPNLLASAWEALFVLRGPLRG